MDEVNLSGDGHPLQQAFQFIQEGFKPELPGKGILTHSTSRLVTVTDALGLKLDYKPRR